MGAVVSITCFVAVSISVSVSVGTCAAFRPSTMLLADRIFASESEDITGRSRDEERERRRNTRNKIVAGSKISSTFSPFGEDNDV